MASQNYISGRYQDGSYAERNPTFGDDTAEWKARAMVRAIRRWSVPHDTVLEIGCGGGGILVQLEQNLDPRTRLTGIEPMPEAFAVARQRATPRLDFEPGAIGPDETRTWDLVLLLDVFEHIEDYLGFLRMIRPRGRHFLFHIPLDMTVLNLLRGSPIRRVREKVGHLHYFSRYTALESLADAGYEVAGWFYNPSAGSGYKGGAGFHLMNAIRKLGRTLGEDSTTRILGGASLVAYARPRDEAHDVRREPVG